MKKAPLEWKERWLNSYLNLSTHHPHLKRLEQAIWQFACDFASNPRNGKLIIIYGNNGCGKTHSLRSIITWLRDRAMEMPLVPSEQGFKIPDFSFTNWPRRVSAFKGGDWDTSDLLDASLTILDDVGAEHDPSRFSAEQLYLILEQRARKWTIITTNICPDSWEEKFERRISDRLLRNAVHVDLSEVPSYSINT